MIIPVPSSIDFFTPLLGHHPMVTSLPKWSEVIIHPMKDGDGTRTFELGPIVTMSSHPWDSNAKNKTHQIPHNKRPCFLICLARKLCGTQWSEDLWRSTQQAIPFLTLTFDSSELTLPPFIEPSQYNEPPIPGTSPSSKPPEDVSACEPEPEVAPKQSSEEPFAPPSTFLPWRSLPLPPRTQPPPPPAPSSPHSHNEACQEFTNLQPTLMIPQAIAHKSIN
ncbi:hypothetical protein O181_060575 [Austropuccinia psidii MF-1]|uniref:Uncharacterized protein n=1 Tax=Austropuccinia psidii MF-1 TaxID=1389203 RepID=A0A9Q3EDK4_9BASI|nr:hypothetical protein [Austropuccinia psidii MF-1]